MENQISSINLINTNILITITITTFLIIYIYWPVQLIKNLIATTHVKESVLLLLPLLTLGPRPVWEEAEILN